jgi:hypothetical protein
MHRCTSACAALKVWAELSHGLIADQQALHPLGNTAGADKVTLLRCCYIARCYLGCYLACCIHGCCVCTFPLKLLNGHSVVHALNADLPPVVLS